jgi:hypothetical protein
MAERLNTREDLGAAERRALEAWSVGEPPHDLTERVLERAARERRRVRWMAAGGLALAAGIAAMMLLVVPHPPVRGEHRAERRTTLTLAGTAVVVAEPAAELSWSVSGRRAVVEQKRGAAFYRVERGAAFEVRTPHGVARALGTCFDLEVREMKVSQAGLLGTAAGAVVASGVLLTVYEGQVLWASPAGAVKVEAGETVRAPAGLPPARLDRAAGGETRTRRTGEPAVPRRGPAAPSEPAAAAAPEVVAALQRRNRELAAEAARLRDKIRSLQPGRDKKPNRDWPFDLPKETLLAMADRCELVYDMPPLGGGGMPKDVIDELGLNETEAAAVAKKLEAYRQRMTRALQELYLDATSDEAGTAKLTPRAMRQVILDRTPHDELQRVYQKLARERAGLEAPPRDLAGTSAAERLLRLLAGAGDRFERDLGAEIGPDLARRLREINNGFGSTTRGSPGCPKAER